MGGEDIAAAEVSPLTAQVLMMDPDEATLLAREGMLDQEPLATAIVVLWGIQWGKDVSEVEVVLKLCCQKYVAIVAVGDAVEPDVQVTGMGKAAGKDWLSIPHLGDGCLLPLQSVLVVL